MDEREHVGVLGATSLVGQNLLARLSKTGCAVTAYSRKEMTGNTPEIRGVSWRRLPTAPRPENGDVSPCWICAAPIWVLPEYFSMLESHGAKKIVALSSTSRFTKETSPDESERATARRLVKAEDAVREWAEKKSVPCVILRPTLIYGYGRDKNIAEIARFIRRFGFFPIFGEARGLRQPIHADDLADACVASLTARLPDTPKCRAYALSGAETLSYREMVGRVFGAMGKPVRILKCPLPVFRIATCILRFHPRYRHWNGAMAERMNRNMVFDHSSARNDFGFSPRPFRLEAVDVAS